MQSRAIETMIREALVQLGQSEGQSRPAGGAGVRQACAERGKLIDLLMVEGKGQAGMGTTTQNVPYMFL
ncbi:MULTISPECIES: hypothetical protein [Sphingobium]|uniref:Uncharacterized protein n=1 Tax=Sphingobium fuliginis (strain ATCC 27551) TaxID=336203 RepID=A0ABQ1EWX5_SPHSA|nr:MULTISPECIES: hypothetical protein [Sphingobium]WDA34916.1 hypothetical protein PO876_15740 [Sphingobium sp. YC-XJ3]GFZ91177.1 hypothetical protein GCM10019071_21570 [Sphingobium fuliginis]